MAEELLDFYTPDQLRAHFLSLGLGMGVPLLVVRAVLDSAERALPRAVIGSIAPNGRARTALVMARLMLRPWETPQVQRLRRDMDAALAALRALTAALGPALTTFPEDP